MEIKFYTTSTISGLVSTVQYRTLLHIPITRLRTVSHSLNPRASADDKILFVAWEGGEVTGYLGVLADRMFHKERPVRIGWLSCFWVDPAHRGKKLAQELFMKVMEAWDNHILITNMAPGTLNFYLRTNLFRPPLYKEGFRGFMRFNLGEILTPKKEIFRRIRPVLKAADGLGNIILGLRFLFVSKKKFQTDLRVEEVTGINTSTVNFISEHNREEHIRRNKAELEWILGHPWLTVGSSPTEESRRYYFSLIARRFSLRFLEFYDDKELAAFMVLSIRDNRLTVPYIYTADGRLPAIAEFLVKTLLDEKLSMITVFHGQLAAAMRSVRAPFLVRRKILRPYLSPLDLDISSLAFQDGDGDSVFT
jgi:GNAT superfamily N-acetyltransferase